MSKLPHRQLRNTISIAETSRVSKLPHRQLRKLHKERIQDKKVNCRTGSLEIDYPDNLTVFLVNCRTGSLEMLSLSRADG
ncbi:Predicted protein (fragment) [Desulfamplus magnetovallimortis]|uniref:Uncharacterized protein n=1 Tax=Desulfamplus magnetovallimortis TaxID=1246637 RepID=A0A1W1HHM0_9BACT